MTTLTDRLIALRKQAIAEINEDMSETGLLVVQYIIDRLQKEAEVCADAADAAVYARAAKMIDKEFTKLISDADED